MTAAGASDAAVLDAPREPDAGTRSDQRSFNAWQCGLSDEDGEVHCEVVPELIVELL
ncbi:MAG: hypothetical protein ABI534_01420 [Chloroflexota bacterium]